MTFWVRVILFLNGLISLSTLAEVRVAEVFGSRMVLQQGVVIPVWGWADPDEEISVHFLDQKKRAIASSDGDGEWI